MLVRHKYPSVTSDAFLLQNNAFKRIVCTTFSGGFRGGGGGCIPPTSLKVTILAEKSASVSNNSAPFRDASPPTDLNVTNPAKNQSQFWWRPFFFFFFFFLETTWIWAKKTFEFPISAEKSLSILVKTFFFSKNHSQFWWRHPNFWGFVLQIPPHQNFLDPPLTTLLWKKILWAMRDYSTQANSSTDNN